MPQKPTLFVASSSRPESLKVAEKLIDLLKKHAYIKFWKDPHVFPPGTTTMSDLINISLKSDIGLFIFNKDDDGKIENREVFYTRGNVLIEYGLFVSKVGLERSIILVPENANDLELPSDIKGITYVSYDASCGEISLNKTVSIIEKSIRDLQSEKNANYYFQEFYEKEEPQLQDGKKIDYHRCIKLLLFMFETQKFKEFRTLDLAFSRWKELNNDKVNTNQITNYSHEILSSVQHLFAKGHCLNFRRIFVISKKEPLTIEDFEVLRIIQNAEKEAVKMRKGRPNIGRKNEEVLESRILHIEPHEFRLPLSRLNDFALFSGDISEFSIVETSLESPFNSNVKPHCIIVNNRPANNERKLFFDERWNNDTLSIQEFLDKFSTQDKMQTILKAFDKFQATYSNKALEYPTVSLIIETAYVELYRENDIKRQFHIRRAFELIKLLNAMPILKERMLLCTFINDFREKSESINCILPCDFKRLSNIPDLKKNIVAEYRNENLYYVDEDSVRTFFMTETRNRAVKSIKNIMQDSVRSKLLVYEVAENNTSQILLKTKSNLPIYLGYQNKNTVIIPNCALLMAQHYFDLFCESFKKNSSQKEFWIFDFNVREEENAVKKGAEAASLLFHWPKGITLHIINFNYSDNGGGDLYHHGPFKF